MYMNTKNKILHDNIFVSELNTKQNKSSIDNKFNDTKISIQGIKVRSPDERSELNTLT